MTPDVETHAVTVTSVQEFQATFYPDSERVSELLSNGYAMEFHDVAETRYSCRCGEDFDRKEAAYQHLLNVREDDDGG